MIRKNKYNAKTSLYNGRSYHSRKEASYAETLDWLKKSGEIKDWKPQKKIEISVNGKHICNHYVDFEVYYHDGHVEWHEVKSIATITDSWRIKKKIIEATYDVLYKIII